MDVGTVGNVLELVPRTEVDYALRWHFTENRTVKVELGNIFALLNQELVASYLVHDILVAWMAVS